MTPEERAVIENLARAWDAFLALPRQHPDEVTEFRHGIHGLQCIVMARPTERAMAEGTAA